MYFKYSHDKQPYFRLDKAISHITDDFKVAILNPSDIVCIYLGTIYTVVSSTNLRLVAGNMGMLSG
jgi:hypothetical protein